MMLHEYWVREERGCLLPVDGGRESGTHPLVAEAHLAIREAAEEHEPEQSPGPDKKKKRKGKRGWMTIRRKHKGHEEVSHLYVGHDGEILEGPDHLKGRHIEDLRGEGTDEEHTERKNVPEPYDKAGRHHPRGSAHITDDAAGRVEKGKKEREADSRRVYGHRGGRAPER